MPRNATRSGQKAPIRGYDNWTIGELQKKLGRRTVDELQELHDYEKAGRARKGALEAIERVISKKSEDAGDRKRSSSRGRTVTKKAKARATKIAKPIAPPVKSAGASMMSKMKELVGWEDLGELSREELMNKLSQMLEHERNGAAIYEMGLEKVEDEEQREKLEEFLEQTRNHVEVLGRIISELGGNPDELSEAAELNRQKAEGLLEVDAPGAVGLINYFETLMIAELVDHMNWEFLEKATGMIKDEEIKAVLDREVGEIEDEEDEHYHWAQKQVEKLTQKCVFSGADEASGEEGEDTEEDDEGEDQAAE